MPSKEALEVTKTLETPSQELTRGTKFAGRYEIVEKLGTGGMGSVFRVEDTKIHEDVALKLIRPDIAADKKTIERFSNELKLARKIRHKNVSGMYDLGEAEGTHFITMEYVSGEDLKSFIRRSKQLSIPTVVSIASQVCEGLAEAHRLGIIHRDLKPSNIMIDKAGNARIMDFGIARLLKGEAITGENIIVGTPDYMSPEQLEGKEIDRRSDIYSLGVVLFEMLTGERPFKGDISLSVAMKHKSEAPPNPKWLNDQIPDRLSRLVLKCLEKDKERRYQSAEELLSAFNSIDEEKIHIADEGGKKKSIVVLPFENLSPDPEQEYFCDGMTEEIISDLSKGHTLKVISRSSAMTLKGTKKKVKEIAQEVNVRYVLEGSVRKAGNNLRITAQLIDATTDEHLWAEKYSGTLDDVFDIQEKVSRSIVDALKITLSTEEDEKISERPIENIQAYECYLKAMQEAWTFTNVGLDKAAQLLQKGLNIVGENSLLYEGLGTVKMFYIAGGIILEQSYLDEAKEYARKIFELDPDNAGGHSLLGGIAYKVGDYKTALKHCRKAHSLNPNHTFNLVYLIIIYSEIGKFTFATQSAERLLEIDPLNSYSYCMFGWKLTFEGRFKEANLAYKKAVEQEPQNVFYLFCYGQSLAYNDQLKEAYEIFDKLQQLADVDSSFYAIASIYKYSLLGEKNKALESINPKLEEHLKWDTELPWWLADCYAMIGEKKKAFEMLEYAISRGFLNYPFLNECDPFLENIRREPRFKKLMERVRHEWENFEV